jgi:hypothetical protein
VGEADARFADEEQSGKEVDRLFELLTISGVAGRPGFYLHHLIMQYNTNEFLCTCL